VVGLLLWGSRNIFFFFFFFFSFEEEEEAGNAGE
jgi:hypothetical protein